MNELWGSNYSTVATMNSTVLYIYNFLRGKVLSVLMKEREREREEKAYEVMNMLISL